MNRINENFSTVYAIVSNIKNIIEGSFGQLRVLGEVSNFSLSYSGHYYFTLKDENAQMSVAVFKLDAMRNPLLKKIKNGDLVIVEGNLNVYPKGGTFQLVGKAISEFGVGPLQKAYEDLKNKLKLEGLFDQSHKLKIPNYCTQIALISAPKAAGLQDFLTIMERRAIEMNISFFPALMQGEKAPQSIMSALKKIEGQAFDVVVITRGGGSFEDLFCFNDEKLVRFLHQFKIPVITAIGHQIDFTLSDLVSDLRCETPSAAAEFLTNYQLELKRRIELLGHQLLKHVNLQTRIIENILLKGSPEYLLQLIASKFNVVEKKLSRYFQILLKIATFEFNEKNLILDEVISRLQNVIKNKMTFYENKLELTNSQLNLLGPQKILQRGYVILSKENDNVITSHQKFSKLEDNKLKIQFHDGSDFVYKDLR